MSSQNPENSLKPEELTEELNQASIIEASENKILDEDPLAKLENELAELRDNHLRLHAEFENFRKRSLKERSELIRYAGSDIMTSLLPVLDDFERARKALNHEPESPAKEGFVLIHNKMLSILESNGLKAMPCVGEEFNSDLHEAISRVDSESALKGKIVDELEKGYQVHDRIIRFAKVVVGS